tara:strand:+ start:154 stop:324 length:171 start_codon:yes stop_codon:yes gene_type:complete
MSYRSDSRPRIGNEIVRNYPRFSAEISFNRFAQKQKSQPWDSRLAHENYSKLRSYS